MTDTPPAKPVPTPRRPHDDPANRTSPTETDTTAVPAAPPPGTTQKHPPAFPLPKTTPLTRRAPRSPHVHVVPYRHLQAHNRVAPVRPTPRAVHRRRGRRLQRPCYWRSPSSPSRNRRGHCRHRPEISPRHHRMFDTRPDRAEIPRTNSQYASAPCLHQRTPRKAHRWVRTRNIITCAVDDRLTFLTHRRDPTASR